MYVAATKNIFRAYDTATALTKTNIEEAEAEAEDKEGIEMENAEQNDLEDEKMKM